MQTSQNSLSTTKPFILYLSVCSHTYMLVLSAQSPSLPPSHTHTQSTKLNWDAPTHSHTYHWSQTGIPLGSQTTIHTECSKVDSYSPSQFTQNHQDLHCPQAWASLDKKSSTVLCNMTVTPPLQYCIHWTNAHFNGVAISSVSAMFSQHSIQI